MSTFWLNSARNAIDIPIAFLLKLRKGVQNIGLKPLIRLRVIQSLHRYLKQNLPGECL